MKHFIATLVLVFLIITGIVLSHRQEFLVHAAVRGDITILDGLLAIGADPNSNATGSYPLYAAVWHRKLDAAARLITHGADVNAREPSGAIPLVTAASRGDDAMVRLLLAHGADPLAVSPCGSALDVASANHHASTAAILAAAILPGTAGHQY